jgi:hypothetical protein
VGIRLRHILLSLKRVERAMGIENTAGADSRFGIMKLQARRGLRAIFV